MITARKNALYSYDGTVGAVCVVPFNRFQGVNLDASGKPVSVIYPTNSCYGAKNRFYKDLKGLNVSDYCDRKIALVVYELGDGTLLAADAEAFKKATFSSNNACSQGSACYVHQVSDLELLEKFPVDLRTGKHGLVAFEF